MERRSGWGLLALVVLAAVAIGAFTLWRWVQDGSAPRAEPTVTLPPVPTTTPGPESPPPAPAAAH